MCWQPAQRHAQLRQHQKDRKQCSQGEICMCGSKDNLMQNQLKIEARILVLPEHGYILQCHLRGSILANRHTTVRPSNVDVCLRDHAHPEVVKGTGQEAGKCGHKSNGPVTTLSTNTNLGSEH